MKSMKLTVNLKERIVDNFLLHWEGQYKKPSEPEARHTIESDFAKALRAEKYGEYDHLPDDIVNKSVCLCIRLPNDSVVSYNFLKDGEDMYDYKALPVSSKRGVQVDLLDGHTNPHYIKYLERIKEAKEVDLVMKGWQKNRNEFQGKVLEVLNSVNTTKQFVDVWPEAEKFIPDDVRDPSTINLPALANIEELNKVIS